jgi:hypothetical protein
MGWSWENAAGGAATGAVVGAPLGPIGIGVGAVGGGLIGGMGGFGDIMKNMIGEVDFDNKYSANNDSRSWQQSQALNQIGQWGFTGEGPSAAQKLVEMNRSQNAANMIGSAKSMPGGNPALANQLAAEGIARGNASATLGGAQIRSAEQQAMIGNYMSGLSGARDQDIRMHESKLAADQRNTDKKQAFIGGIMSSFSGGMG